MIRRNTLLALLAFGALPLHAFAQPVDKVYRIAISVPNPAAAIAGPVPSSPAMRAFVEGLKALGYVEGRNLILDRRSRYGLDAQGMDDLMADIVRTKPDVIVLDGTGQAVRATKLTSSIPIVMAASVDPVGAGLAQSLARPGRNVTGLVTDVGTGSEEKRLEIFLELLAKARRLAFVGTKGDWESPWGNAIRSIAAKRRLDLFFAEGTPVGFADALEALRRKKSEAFFVALSPSTGQFGSLFGEFTVSSRIPSSCGITEMAERGCLMAYGQSAKNFFAYAVTYVDKILKGAKPGDLPIEQPTKFELVINMKTANALGLKIPQSILLRADRVIE
jgi:putative ABC transport system substrate-binding protein